MALFTGKTMTEPDEYDDDDRMPGEPWCRDFEGHKALHEFCSDHQAMWCRKCDRGCPSCFDDPHCPECHCSLFCDEHDWDCSYYGED
jgi:hypothetical protein